jgi:hypothetical protein
MTFACERLSDSFMNAEPMGWFHSRAQFTEERALAALEGT